MDDVIFTSSFFLFHMDRVAAYKSCDCYWAKACSKNLLSAHFYTYYYDPLATEKNFKRHPN